MFFSLMKYASLTPAQLTPTIIGEIAGAMGFKIDPTDVVTNEIMTLLAEEKIDQLGDLLGRQDVFPKVAAILQPQVNPEVEIIDFNTVGELE